MIDLQDVLADAGNALPVRQRLLLISRLANGMQMSALTEPHAVRERCCALVLMQAELEAERVQAGFGSQSEPGKTAEFPSRRRVTGCVTSKR